MVGSFWWPRFRHPQVCADAPEPGNTARIVRIGGIASMPNLASLRSSVNGRAAVADTRHAHACIKMRLSGLANCGRLE